MKMSEWEYQTLLAQRQKAWGRPSGLPPNDSSKEEDLLKRVRSLARLHGWLCYHTYDSRRSEPGFPDVVATNGQRVLFAELKNKTGKVTREQQQWLELLAHAQTIDVHLWRPSDDVAAYFGAL